MLQEFEKLNETIHEKSQIVEVVMKEIGKRIIGQKDMIQKLLIGLFTGGHILIEGIPGLAKTLTIKTLASIINAKFQRVQFTPDLLPTDILGTMIYHQKEERFITEKGPIFANIILADEINRAPAKVQSALLEAMQEKQVTISKGTYPLEEPFLVLATQNPIEQEGTYPLPEAQVDRFMLKLTIDYPSREEEFAIVNLYMKEKLPPVNPLLTPTEILSLRKLIEEIYVDDKIKNYVLDIVFATRSPEKFKLKELAPFISYGASPRASIYLVMAAKAHAFLHGRGFVIPEDIKEMGWDILRHRIILSYQAEAEEMNTEKIIEEIFRNIKSP